MARVNVDSQALTDARFAVLANLMGSDDPDLALGRMVRVWMQCIERETYVITQSVIVALFRGNPDAPEWLIQAELAEHTHGGLRIKGTQGRIEYLAEQRARARQNGKLGGRPPRTQSVVDNNPDRLASKTPPTPAPAPTPALKENTPQPPSGECLDSAKPKRAKRKPATDAGPDFARFWGVYPNLVAKPRAVAAWRKLNPDPELVAAILAGVERYKREKPEWQSYSHPASWLNARRWEDQPAPEANGNHKPTVADLNARMAAKYGSEAKAVNHE